MLAALAIIVALPAQYQSALICKVPAQYMRSYVQCSVLTDQGTVAGYTCDTVGHHGETFMGKPFVWSKGKLHQLTLGPKAEFGHVFDGNDRLLVGSVDIDHRSHPATWTPDPALGWAKAKLKVLTTLEGEATHVGPDGTIWVQNKNEVIGCFQGGKWQKVSMGPFNLEGFDAQSNLYGNQVGGVHFGGRPADTKPGRYVGNTWEAFKVERADPNVHIDHRLLAVNSSGVAVGNCDNQAAIWKNGQLSFPLGRTKRWSRAYDINDSGMVIGEYAVKDVDSSMPYLWEKGQVQNLSTLVSSISAAEATKINNRGDIAVVGYVKASAHLYLLTRK